MPASVARGIRKEWTSEGASGRKKKIECQSQRGDTRACAIPSYERADERRNSRAGRETKILIFLIIIFFIFYPFPLLFFFFRPLCQLLNASESGPGFP
jgi:hypothetical protein